MMIERTIKRFIDEKVDWYYKKPIRFQRFLIDECGIGEAEAAKARAFFAGDGKPRAVVGYARSSGPFPCFAIVLSADTMRQRFVGNDMGPAGVFIDPKTGEAHEDDFVDEDGKVAEGRAWIISPRYDIWVYALDNADVCLYYYYLLRHNFLAHIDDLIDGNIGDLELSGQDMAPDPRYMPENIFIRRLSISGIAMENGFFAQPRANKISGATHEDSGGGISPIDGE